MTWNDQYRVKSKTINAQHKQLFELINQSHEAMKSGQTKTVLSQVLDRLIRYTRTHFSDEEDALVEAGYPDFVAHVAEHRKLTEHVENLSKDVKESRAGISIQVMDFLQHWLTNHIMRVDQKYVPYLKTH